VQAEILGLFEEMERRREALDPRLAQRAAGAMSDSSS
jgi:hypothetical protein